MNAQNNLTARTTQELERKLAIAIEARNSCAIQVLDAISMLNEANAELEACRARLGVMEKIIAIPAVAAAIAEAKKVDAKKEEK